MKGSKKCLRIKILLKYVCLTYIKESYIVLPFYIYIYIYTHTHIYTYIYAFKCTPNTLYFRVRVLYKLRINSL